MQENAERACDLYSLGPCAVISTHLVRVLWSLQSFCNKVLIPKSSAEENKEVFQETTAGAFVDNSQHNNLKLDSGNYLRFEVWHTM